MEKEKENENENEYEYERKQQITKTHRLVKKSVE